MAVVSFIGLTSSGRFTAGFLDAGGGVDRLHIGTPRRNNQTMKAATAGDSSLAARLQRRRAGGDAMIDRAKFPTAWAGCEISVVTERLRDGRWGVVAGIQEVTPEHTRTIDLPVPSETFATQEEAQSHGVEQATRDRKSVV